LKYSRRDFVKDGSASLVYSSAFLHGHESYAKTLNLPLGLQLYSVRELLPKDYAGTLKDVAALGYREVEAAGYYNHSVSEVKLAMDNAKLNLVSAHYSLNDLHQQLDQIIVFNKKLGVGHIICSFPGFKDPLRLKNMSSKDRIHAFTLEDWQWNAGQLNMIGEKINAVGMRFGYHNHTMEFREVDGVIPYVELLRLTDPTTVTMEMDCGWVVVGGGNPIEYLRSYPTRITMLHVKDFKWITASITNPPTATELGQGTIDYRPIFQEAAKNRHVKHCFVEQEEFDMPPMQSLKIDANYMRKLCIS
jgi:sugar phosphate isomerase/epimerase